MDYQKHYTKLIKRAKNRLLEGYVEKHHIVPRCMNGSNDTENIVALTPEEHYVAHQLLVKIYPDESKLAFAAHMMTVSSSNHLRNNKWYGWLRRKYSEVMSESQKGNKHALGCKRSEETKQKISESTKGKNKGKIPWNKGIPQLEESKQKQSKKMKDKIPWNKGLKTGPRTEETKQEISKSNKGRISWNRGLKTGPLSEDHKRNIGLGNKGKTKGRIPWNKGMIKGVKYE